jgi:hypothetical protein
MESRDSILSGDELYFDPKEQRGALIRYGDEISRIAVGTEGNLKLEEASSLQGLTPFKILNSLISFSGRIFEITVGLEVIGYDVTLFVEGYESLRMKKYKLSKGLNKSHSGFFLDRIWFTKSQGIIGQASYQYVNKDKVNSYTRVHYEDRTVLKDYEGIKRQFDFSTSTTIKIGNQLNLGLSGNYNSSNIWNTKFWLHRNWKNQLTVDLDFSYNKPVHRRGEAWVGINSRWISDKVGYLSFIGRYEFSDQIFSQMTFNRNLFKNVKFFLSTSYSKIKVLDDFEPSRLIKGAVSLTYQSKLFNLGTDYNLNYDLFGSRLLTQPRLMLGMNPIKMYGGLLELTVMNTFIYNWLKQGDTRDSSYSNNTLFNLATETMDLNVFQLKVNVNVEQFLEKEGRNFTSTGFILDAQKEIFKGVSLKCYYSLQSRRKTKNWLVEGTTSQDLSTFIKVYLNERIKGWISFSYDPKDNQWRQSFADVSLYLWKKWKFHTLLNYDFILKKINNVDLYLIREAGRFEFRVIWRSLSHQFLVELVPR